MPDPPPLGLKIAHVPEITCMLKIEHEPLARAFPCHAFLWKKVVESGNRAQKSVEIENRTQDLRVFSFACYQLSHIGRSESGGLGGVGGSGALKSVR